MCGLYSVYKRGEFTPYSKASFIMDYAEVVCGKKNKYKLSIGAKKLANNTRDKQIKKIPSTHREIK